MSEYLPVIALVLAAIVITGAVQWFRSRNKDTNKAS